MLKGGEDSFYLYIMRFSYLVIFILLPLMGKTQSSGAVLKAGFIWNDYLRDNRNVLSRSQGGATIGLEVRLGAEDNTYFKLGGYFARIHMQMQDHPKETKFFKVVDGYDLLKGLCGLETRLLTGSQFNWRLGATAAINFISDVRGSTKFADINSGFVGLHLTTGVDVSIFSLDLAVEPGFTNFKKDTADSKPTMMMLTLGFRF